MNFLSRLKVYPRKDRKHRAIDDILYMCCLLRNAHAVYLCIHIHIMRVWPLGELYIIPTVWRPRRVEDRYCSERRVLPLFTRLSRPCARALYGYNLGCNIERNARKKRESSAVLARRARSCTSHQVIPIVSVCLSRCDLSFVSVDIYYIYFVTLRLMRVWPILLRHCAALFRNFVKSERTRVCIPIYVLAVTYYDTPMC